MRRILTILVAILFVASFAAAQTGGTTGGTGTVQKKGGGTKPAAHQLTGAVAKADASSVTIKPTKGAEETFVINADTKVTQGTKAMTAADIKSGEKVVVHYTKSGDTMTATKIALPAPKAAPKTSEKPKTEPKK